jgi:uncharacterized repeat protein (TIGR04076 family)
MSKKLDDDQFELYDLGIVVESIDGDRTCQMAVGDSVFLRGGKISMPDGEDFCLYALQSVIPLLPAKQRLLHPADWMETDTRALCPDPGCGLTMRVDRLEKRVLKHDDVSPIKWRE